MVIGVNYSYSCINSFLLPTDLPVWAQIIQMVSVILNLVGILLCALIEASHLTLLGIRTSNPWGCSVSVTRSIVDPWKWRLRKKKKKVIFSWFLDLCLLAIRDIAPYVDLWLNIDSTSSNMTITPHRKVLSASQRPRQCSLRPAASR